MAKGFDCATPLNQELAEQFRTNGMEFVCRYLVPTGWKRLTLEEAEVISEAGMLIGSVFETIADRALAGYQGGYADGIKAVEVAKSVGQPYGSCIYFAVDFDATDAQMQIVIDYIRGASEATPNYNTGVYGSFAVVESVRAAGVCSRYWQTYAWSHGKVSSPIHIHQHDNGADGLGLFMNSIKVDLNESYEDEGFWSLKELIQLETVQEPTPDSLSFDQVSAQKVIDDLGSLYRACADPAVQAAAHYAADVLRVATGISLADLSN